jgi:hypothetical protein
VARKLPEGEELDLNEDQLAKLAEQELLNAAKQIEAAAARIMSIQAPEFAEGDAGTEAGRVHNVNEAILGTARSITQSTAALVAAGTLLVLCRCCAHC